MGEAACMISYNKEFGREWDEVGQLAVGIAHNFNNMLTIIMGYGDLIKQKIGQEDEIHRDIYKILVASERAANLTRDILAYSRSRKGFIDLEPANLNDVIRDMEGVLVRFVGQNIKLNIHLTVEDTSTMVDVSRIRRVILSLCQNAIDAMPQGGKLLLETKVIHMPESGDQTNGDTRQDAYVSLSVMDSGSGMNEETKNKIFQPFFTTKGSTKNAGLGLAVVHGTIKQHNGHISVHSELQKGTSIEIYLPLDTSKMMRLAV